MKKNRQIIASSRVLFVLTKLAPLDSKKGIVHKEEVIFSQVGPSRSFGQFGSVWTS
jgi:hypothetical protein